MGGVVKKKQSACHWIVFFFKETLLALVRDLFTFSSKVIKRYKRTFECKKRQETKRKKRKRRPV
jgi:hypothetical protein